MRGACRHGRGRGEASLGRLPRLRIASRPTADAYGRTALSAGLS
jgi:hypothetical protein